MQKWEYYLISCEFEHLAVSENSLIEAGKEGWELVSVDNGVAYFKRPIKREIDNTIYGRNIRGEMVPIGVVNESEKPLIDAIGKPLD